MKKISIITVFAISCLNLSAQKDTIFNQVDEKGMKQGYWQKYYPNGMLMYKGEFKNNIPVGTMKRYYESGGIQAIIRIDSTGDYAKAQLFYEDSELSAEGGFYKMQKDSVWKYYSYYSGALVSEETYSKGKKVGVHKSFYENGQVSEETEWHNDYKEGKWIQYFPDGKVKMRTTHNYNMVNGRYYFYYDHGLMMILGNFVDHKRHGPWAFSDKNGKEKYPVDYEYGKALNDEFIKKDEEFFEYIEENIGKFEEPSLEDFFPGRGGY